MTIPTLKLIILRSIVCTAFVWVFFYVLNILLSGHFWDGMVVSKSSLTAEYCEHNNTEQFFHQSMNTYSNLVYVFFGILVFLIGQNDSNRQGISSQNRLESFPALSKLMGICFVYLGFGSAFFHASLTWIGQRVDMNGTYSISIMLLIIGLYHVFCKTKPSSKTQKTIVVLACLLILSFYKIALMVSSSVLLPLMILGVWLLVGIHYFQDRRQRSIVVAVLSLVLIVVAIKISYGCSQNKL
jgi:hypothetical protein